MTSIEREIDERGFSAVLNDVSRELRESLPYKTREWADILRRLDSIVFDAKRLDKEARAKIDDIK